MSRLEADAPLNRRLLHDRPGRTFEVNEGSRWGEIIRPAPDENPDKTEEGMRLLLVASLPTGYATTRTVTAYERRFPERLNLVALVTDDPINPDAKVGVKKRLWKHYDFEETLAIETGTVETALESGTAAYTGEIKVDWFRERAAALEADAIVVCGFGQIIDRAMMDLPPLGIYNCHPSDLAHGLGAGLAPFDFLYERNASTTAWAIHHVSEEVDGGHLVGSSPPINVRTAEGELPSEIAALTETMMYPQTYMIRALLDVLTRRHALGLRGKIDSIDFESRFPDEVKERLLEPVPNRRKGFASLELDADLFE